MSISSATMVRPLAGEGNHIRRSVSNVTLGGSPFAELMTQEKDTQSKNRSPAAVATSARTPEQGIPLQRPKTTLPVVDLQRSPLLAGANIDLKRTQALQTMATLMPGATALETVQNTNTMRNLRSVLGGFSLTAPTGISIANYTGKGQIVHTGKRKTAPAPQQAAPAPEVEQDTQDTELGKLAAQFESGKDGIAAIGYDRHGGTSYGKYQIASRVGSMDRFLNFLDTAAPDMAKALRGAGPANTGSRRGGMPNMWRKLAAEQPDRFEALQEKFIYDSHYKPALEGILQQTALKESQITSTMQEVLWSTAVQHGPTGAVRIFSRAAQKAAKGKDSQFDKQLINNIYAIRAEQFGSSTEQVQHSVRNRMQREKMMALNMLKDQKTTA